MHHSRLTLIMSPSLDVQDLYVVAFRVRRRRALGVGSDDAAIAAIAHMDVSAVLYDIERADDWESLAAFRREVEPRMPVIVISSCVAADRSYRRLARRMGCAAFVAKPCCPSVVVRAVEHAASGGSWAEYEEPVARREDPHSPV